MNQDHATNGWAYRSNKVGPNTHQHYYRSTARFALSLCGSVTSRGFPMTLTTSALKCPKCAARLAATGQPDSK
jgi:hypothetical protein